MYKVTHINMLCRNMHVLVVVVVVVAAAVLFKTASFNRWTFYRILMLLLTNQYVIMY